MFYVDSRALERTLGSSLKLRRLDQIAAKAVRAVDFRTYRGIILKGDTKWKKRKNP